MWTIPSSVITLKGETDLVNTKPSETYIALNLGTFTVIPIDDYLNLLKIYAKVGINCDEQTPNQNNPNGIANCTSKKAI